MDVSAGKSTYKRKTGIFFAETTLQPELAAMADKWEAKMTQLNEYQALGIGICNGNGVPSARRAAFICMINMWYSTFITRMIAGAAAEREGLAILDYLTVLFALTDNDRALGIVLADDLFSVLITLPEESPALISPPIEETVPVT
jgi:hypothetical protein